MKTLEFRNMDIVVKPIEDFMKLYPSKVEAVINTSGSPSAWTNYGWSTIWTPGKGRDRSSQSYPRLPERGGSGRHWN